MSDSFFFYCDDGWYSNHSRQRTSTYMESKKVQMKWTLQNVCAVQTGDVTWCEWGGTSMTRSRRPPLMNLRALARLTQAWLPCSRLQSLQSKHSTSCCSFDNVDVTLCLFDLHVYVWTCWSVCCSSVSFVIASSTKNHSERWGEVIWWSVPLFALQVLGWSLPSHTVEIQIYTTV